MFAPSRQPIADSRGSVPSGREERIPALDGLRAIASLGVVFLHFFPHIVRDPDSPFAFVLSLTRWGGEGVDLFFVLSGFLISRILVDARDSPNYFRTFYIRRALRIFPLYYLVLLGFAATAAALRGSPVLADRLFAGESGAPLPLWTYFLYLQNFAMTVGSNFGAFWLAGSWSLAVEEQFYFTLPALIRKFSRRGLAWFAGACLVLPFLIRAGAQRFRLFPGIGNRVLLFTAMDSLAAGIAVMLLCRYRRAWLDARRAPIGWTVMAALLFWFAYPALVTNPRYAFLDGLFNSLFFGGVLLYVLIAPQSAWGRFLSLPWMRTLGNMGYSTYLFHPILLCLSFLLLRGRDPSLNTIRDLEPLALALAATLFFSYASWRLLESRLIRFGHRWKY